MAHRTGTEISDQYNGMDVQGHDQNDGVDGRHLASQNPSGAKLFRCGAARGTGNQISTILKAWCIQSVWGPGTATAGSQG